jgi:hypothetical protein
MDKTLHSSDQASQTSGVEVSVALLTGAAIAHDTQAPSTSFHYPEQLYHGIRLIL